MKLPRSITRLPLVVLVLAVAAGSASATQYTTTCQSGQWDMLAMMFMQQTYLSQNYYVWGTSKSGGNVYISNIVQISTQNGGDWETGKINNIKDWQGEPEGKNAQGVPQYAATPPYWAYPWDINRFDENYVYLWITEADWGNAYSYKEFYNTYTDSANSMLFTRRCVAPGDSGATSALTDNPEGDTANTTQYQAHPVGVLDGSGGAVDQANETFTSADCGTDQDYSLGYVFTKVGAVKTNAFTLNNTIGGGTITLSLLPVTYSYSGCSSTGTGCGNEEEFDYGIDANNNIYGLVQWTLYQPAGSTTITNQSTFNNLAQWTSTQVSQGKGGTNVSFPCTPK
jgi:hypothetical protein